ncbi:MAG: EAL domain-containing protein [Deltaproteobacteria bacterium]|nr:EAL domain-containing protein [Deltaproteobacteria bacterium]
MGSTAVDEASTRTLAAEPSAAILRVIHHVQTAYDDRVSPSEPLRFVVKELLAITGSAGGFVAEASPGNGRAELTVRAAIGVRVAPEIANACFKKVLTTGGPVLSPEPGVAGLVGGDPAVRSCVAVPLTSGAGIEGLLGLVNRPGGFDDATLDLIAPLAATCGALLAKARVVAERELSERRLREAQDALAHYVVHDHLTGLVNRREFERQLVEAVVSARRGRTHTLAYVDLDQFKLINDTHGHVAGDVVLREVTARLRLHVRGSDTLARLGGDEFGIILWDCAAADAAAIAARWTEEIAAGSSEWNGNRLRASMSVGLVELNRLTRDATEVLSYADRACLAAKEAGGSRVCNYRDDDSYLAEKGAQMRWATRLKEGLANDQFVLFAQEIVGTRGRTGPGKHFEVLVRYKDDDGRLVAPGFFLPAAERYGIIPQLDRWVISHTIAWLGSLDHRLERVGSCAVNVSGRTLDAGFAEWLVDQIDLHRVEPSMLCLELTETAAVEELPRAGASLDRLRASGVRVALDDFGSGLSSFSYLKRLPIDIVKIDGQFIKSLGKSEVDRTIVRSVAEIARSMGKVTVAEWVEDEATLELVRELGVDFVQGYLFGKPGPLAELFTSP